MAVLGAGLGAEGLDGTKREVSEPESKPASPPKNPELEQFADKIVKAAVEGLNQQFPPKKT